MPKNLIQAYQQAPWRVQVQRIGLLLLFLVTSALIAGLYLNIDARAAEAGVEIWQLESEQEDIVFQIQNLHTELADLTSVANMKERAEELDFVRYTPQEVEYLQVPGYQGRQIAQLAPANNGNNVPNSIIKPAYTQSLWDWLLINMIKLGNP